MLDLLNLIGGESREAQNGTWLDNIDPATGQIFARIPRSGKADVAAAYTAAASAFPQWSNTSIENRAACLRNLAHIVSQNAEALAQAESQDNGKPLSLARAVDIPRAEKNLAFFAGAIEQFPSEAPMLVFVFWANR